MEAKLIMVVAESDENAKAIQHEWQSSKDVDSFVDSIREKYPQAISDGDVCDMCEVHCDAIMDESDRYIATVCDQIDETLYVYEKL